MSTSPFAHENTATSAFGEFESFGTADWSEQDWQDYDNHIADEIAAFDAEHGVEDDFFDFDAEPPF